MTYYKVLIDHPTDGEKIVRVHKTGSVAPWITVLHHEKDNGPMPAAKLNDESNRLLSKQRDRKLKLLRLMRKDKFSDYQAMRNDISEGIRSDEAAVKAYRQALKDVTNEFKNHKTNASHATAIDALDVDSFTWPTKP